PATHRAAAWSEALTKAVDKAEAETVPSKRLALLGPALARVDSLEDRDCRRGLRKRAAFLAVAAGDAESGPSDEEAARRLPADATLAAVTEDVRRARGRLLEKSDAASAPENAPAAPAAPAPAPAPAPA